MRAWIAKYSVAVFFVLTFSLAWLVWIPLWLAKIPETPGAVLILLGACAPSVSGILMAAFTGGRPAVKKLLLRVFQWRVNPIYYLLAVLGMAAIILGAIAIHVLLGGTLPAFEMLQKYGLLIPVLFVQVALMNGPLQEEFGWRGFALDELQKDRSVLFASIVIGALWGLWHLPLFGVAYSSQAGIPLGMYLLYHIPLTAIMIWLVDRSDGSLLIALLFHASINIWGILLPLLPKYAGTQRIFDIAVALMWLAAIVLVYFERRMFLQPYSRRS